MADKEKLAMADFQAWYGLQEFDDLDEEYSAVKSMINFEVKEEPKYCLTLDGKTKV